MGMDVDEDMGMMSDTANQESLGVSANKRGKRRALPPVPTDVPAPVSIHLGSRAQLTRLQIGTAAMGVSYAAALYIPY
jgi:hypothetical protein